MSDLGVRELRKTLREDSLLHGDQAVPNGRGYLPGLKMEEEVRDDTEAGEVFDSLAHNALSSRVVFPELYLGKE